MNLEGWRFLDMFIARHIAGLNCMSHAIAHSVSFTRSAWRLYNGLHVLQCNTKTRHVQFVVNLVIWINLTCHKVFFSF